MTVDLQKAETVSVNDRLLWRLKTVCRWALGLVWIWEGLVPKILWTVDERQRILVGRSGLFWPDPESFLALLGAAMIATGIILCVGWWERTAVLTVSLAMTVLVFLVAGNAPALVGDLDGGIAKDLCLYACAWVVWNLAPIVPKRPQGRDRRVIAGAI